MTLQEAWNQAFLKDVISTEGFSFSKVDFITLRCCIETLADKPEILFSTEWDITTLTAKVGDTFIIENVKYEIVLINGRNKEVVLLNKNFSRWEDSVKVSNIVKITEKELIELLGWDNYDEIYKTKNKGAKC